MTLIQDLKNLLERKLYTSLKTSWLEECLLRKNGSIDVANFPLNSLVTVLEKELLNTDLGLVCIGSLPDNVSQIEKGLIGPSPAYLVQIEELVNIGQSSEYRYEDSPHRTLKMTLCDGSQRVAALEVTRISQLSLKSPLGMKILIKNVQVYHGIVSLHPHNLEILGGCVEPLNEYAKWLRIQQKKSFIPKEWEDELGTVELNEVDSTIYIDENDSEQILQKDIPFLVNDCNSVQKKSDQETSTKKQSHDRSYRSSKSDPLYVVSDVITFSDSRPSSRISSGLSGQSEDQLPNGQNAARGICASCVTSSGESNILSDGYAEPCEVLEESLEREIEDVVFRVESSKKAKTHKENFLVELVNFDLEDTDMIYNGCIHSRNNMEAVEDSQFTEFE